MDSILRKNIWIKYFIFAVFCIVTIPCYARNYNGHNKDLKKVLFGNNPTATFSRKNFDLLCKAAYLTIDYTSQPNGEEYIKSLQANGIKNLPPINAITFSDNYRHERYTHMGWDVGYIEVNDVANWNLRKTILTSTVEKIGKFKKNEKIKIDAFAALVYDIHILGDHAENTITTKSDRVRLTSEPEEYKGQVVSPTSAGPFNNPTLYIYLLYHTQRLFRDQKDTFEYKMLENFLNRNKDYFLKSSEPVLRAVDSTSLLVLNNDYFLKSGGQVPYKDIQRLAEKTLKTLSVYIPKLLAREAFFQRAFFE